jgi:transposase
MTGQAPATGASWQGLRVVHPQAAGIDIGSEEIWVAVAPARSREPVRRFGVYTADLQSVAAWLQACGVDTVALEATGVYWIPLYEVLQDHHIEVCVVNAHHFHQVPGRKSDIQDCQWLQELHSVGLLRGSFRPEADMAALRTYLRQRAELLEQRAAHIQHMQKALLYMNVRLPQVLSDITGVSGLAIIRAIVAGERDPQRLAALRQPGLKKCAAEIVQALTGHYQAEHVFVLKQALALYDFYTERVQECDGAIERQFSHVTPSVPPDALPPLPPPPKPTSHSKNAPTYEARRLLYRLAGVDLCAIDGLNASTVQTILSETGTDMSAWPSVKHFCSWLGLAPHNAVSGGKVLRSHTLATHNRAGQAFRLAAQSVMRSRHNAFGAFYRRLCGRVGKKQALVATAHKLARTFYEMLKHHTPYQDLGADEYERQAQERELKRLRQLADKHGMDLTPKATPAPAPT